MTQVIVYLVAVAAGCLAGAGLFVLDASIDRARRRRVARLPR